VGTIVSRSLFASIVGVLVIAAAPQRLHIFTDAVSGSVRPGGQVHRPPAPADTQTYTHYVRPDGSPTSFCTQREPCSLTRAVSLVGSSNMRPGSSVLVQHGADGIYSQAALIFEGSGAADNPIRFVAEDGVRLTGTRFRAPASGWTRVADRQYTYRLPWDAEATFAVGNVAQRPPVSTWRPIVVDDRLPPFTQSLGRPFTLDFPIRYDARSAIDEVEAQHCTFWNDRRTEALYVHMCHDGPPAEADNVYLGSSGWGSITINGDYLLLENLAIEQVTGTALKVNPSAHGTILRKITARAAQVWLEGVNTLAEDLDVSHVIAQGTRSNQCYDANPDFGQGECWNASGDGRALLIGRQGRDASSGQVVRRARVHRSWNGARMDGRHTLEDSTFWGFPNHTFEASGSGGVIRNSVFLNGQDSLYLSAEPFDDLTVENNVFFNGTLFWVNRDKKGGKPPSPWRFRYNILKSVVYDDKTYSSATADCNLWIPSTTSTTAMMRVSGTDGASDASYWTLDEVRSRTPLERNSVALPASKWTDGTLFRNFSGQAARDFDFSPVNPDSLVLCGQTVGPDFARRAIPRHND